LVDALNDNEVAIKGGNFLPLLMKEGLIQTVITTNIDSCLDKAMLGENFKETQIIVYGRQSTDAIIDASEDGGVLLKIFGDLKDEQYRTAGNELDLREDKKLRDYLETLLGQDILLIGFDREWDSPIDWAIPTNGGEIFYLNDMPPSSDLLFYRAFNRRKGKYYQTQFEDGSVTVLEEIYVAYEKASAAREVNLVIAEDNGIAENLIFISYSHKDTIYKDRLRVFLNEFNQQKRVKSWDDSEIEVGDEWYEEIQKAIKAAKVAILLVSMDFFDSKFIMEHELPPILQGVEAKEIKLVQVVLGYCDFENQLLSKYQTINPPSSPLAGMAPFVQEKVWETVLRKVRELLAEK
jgi:hypothetical protein